MLSKQFSLKVSRDIAKLDNEDGASEKEESSEEEESAMSSEEYFDEDLETAVVRPLFPQACGHKERT